jgi:small-conductance mechanosensitive channel
MMQDWVEQELGVAPWVFEGVLLPLLAFLGVLLVREMGLLAFARRVDDAERRKAWRRRTLWVALPLAIVAAAGASWVRQHSIARSIAKGSREVLEVQTYLGSATKVIVYTLLLLMLLLIVQRVYRNVVARIDAWKPAEEGVKVQSAVLLSPERVRSMLTGALRVVRGLLIFVLLYLYIPLILSAIPQTRDLAGKVVPYLMAPVVTSGKAILDYLPDLITLIVIIFVGRYVIRLLRFWMVAIGAGGIKVEGFDADWAEPTYKLGRMLIFLVVVMMSYPYLPGSGSDVFKGFSLFLGALVTLGASSSIANVIAGIILTYTGSFRVGDRVKIGDTVGDVIEKKLFVTRIRTVYNEEVTVPNGLVMQTQIVNYTVSSKKGGLALTIEAGVGYDVDWRTVHGLLKNAASKTESILEEPEPFVLQNGLGDFAVQYKLVAFTEDAKIAVRTVSELRQHALDEFNEAGVEIMTPMIHAVRNSTELTTPNGAAETDTAAIFHVSSS